MVSPRRVPLNAAIAITLWCVLTFRTIWGVNFWFKVCFWLAIMGGLIEGFEAMKMWFSAPVDAWGSLVAFAMFAVGLFGLKHSRPREQRWQLSASRARTIPSN
jgi:hypothetical protein